MILVITPHISWYPILVSLLIRLGREPPRRIEVHSWQVPRVLTVQQLADLVGFSRFLNNHAEHVYVAYGSTIFDGQTATINIERGGHYEIYIQVATLNSFILVVARGTQQQNPSIVAEITEDNEGDAIRDNSAGSSEDEDPALPQTPHLPSIDDDDTVMIQTFQHVKASMIGKNIGQVIFTSLLMLTDCSASYTDEFLDAVWPITIRGERELAAAADLDPDILRIRWLNIESRYGIPRPISIATLLILRPPTVRTPGEEFHLTMARFDDPFLIPTEIADQWPDLRTSTWRLDQGHDFSRFIRTLDMVGSFFTLRQGREMAATNFVTGMVEIISRHNRDEHSRYFSAVLPQHTSWIHLWNWLRLGMGFQGGFNFEVWADGNQVIQPATPFDIAQGFFVQVVANAPTTGSLQVIPTSRFRSWSRELCFSLPSGVGPVYRAGTTIDRSEMARIPYRDRTEAILNRWPGLTVWTAYTRYIRQVAKEDHRGPQWTTRCWYKTNRMESTLQHCAWSTKEQDSTTTDSSFQDSVWLRRYTRNWSVHFVARATTTSVPPRSTMYPHTKTNSWLWTKETTSKSSSSTSQVCRYRCHQWFVDMMLQMATKATNNWHSQCHLYCKLTLSLPNLTMLHHLLRVI